MLLVNKVIERGLGPLGLASKPLNPRFVVFRGGRGEGPVFM